MSKPRNLWPTNIVDHTERRNYPLEVLKEQASAINGITSGYIIGNIMSIQAINPDGSKTLTFHHTLYIIAPKLNGYRIDLIEIVQDNLEEYPCKIQSNISKKYLIANSDSDFDMKVAEILSTPDIRDLVNSIIHRSKLL